VSAPVILHSISSHTMQKSPPPPPGLPPAPLVVSHVAIARVSTPRCAYAEIGIGLTGFGFVLTFLGVLFFFDKGLLAMGNVCRHMRLPTACSQPCAVPPLLSFDRGSALIARLCMQILFVAGVAMTIGAQATLRFFLRRKNQRVTITDLK